MTQWQAEKNNLGVESELPFKSAIKVVPIEKKLDRLEERLNRRYVRTSRRDFLRIVFPVIECRDFRF